MSARETHCHSWNVVEEVGTYEPVALVCECGETRSIGSTPVVVNNYYQTSVNE